MWCPVGSFAGVQGKNNWNEVNYFVQNLLMAAGKNNAAIILSLPLESSMFSLHIGNWYVQLRRSKLFQSRINKCKYDYKIPGIGITNVTILRGLFRLTLFHLLVLPVAPGDRSQKNRRSLRHKNLAVLAEHLWAVAVLSSGSNYPHRLPWGGPHVSPFGIYSSKRQPFCD